MITVDDIVGAFDDAEIRVSKESLKEDVALTEQGLDSLDMATLLHVVEKKWSVPIPMESAARLSSLKDIRNFLNAKG